MTERKIERQSLSHNKRILILSFEPISLTNSNGRTIRNVLKKFPKESIYNIYLHGNPDLKRANYLCVSDKQALMSLFFKKPVFVDPNQDNTNFKKADSKNNRNGLLKDRSNFKLLIREFAWRTHSIRKGLLNQVQTINPDVMVVFFGDAGFMLDNAVYISEKLDIPIITFNCEDYYFKDYDYVKFRKRKSLIHRLYKKVFVKSVKRIMKIASSSIYLTNDLEELYKTEFKNQNSYTIYNSSELVDSNVTINHRPNNHNFVYAGNVRDGRLAELEKVGEIIKTIDPDYYLVVYSQEENEEILRILQSSKNYIFKGSINYSAVINEIKTSFAILHIESKCPFYAKHTIHGFSTKLSDCLASGNCFIALCNEDSTVYKYLKQNSCAYCFSDYEELKKGIAGIIANPDARLKYVNNAIEIAHKYHSSDLNSEKFSNIVGTVIGK